MQHRDGDHEYSRPHRNYDLVKLDTSGSHTSPLVRRNVLSAAATHYLAKCETLKKVGGRFERTADLSINANTRNVAVAESRGSVRPANRYATAER
jgi:hypothetical protein